MAEELDKKEILDEAEEADEEIPYRYAITSYGADYPVESVVNKLEKDAILVPYFQRGYIWSHVEASRFVESLLLGLPVPGVFLSKEEKSQKLLVIDGQQRLKTLQYFYDGVFREGPAKDKAFVLKNVQEQFEGKTYKTLSSEEQLHLDDSIIHATIVKQDSPEGHNSIFHIFERLNTGGRLLTPQEIRSCMYYGMFSELLKELNENECWRIIYGKQSARQKDIELILRFFALLFVSDKYFRPMKGFLNTYMHNNRHLQNNTAEELTEIFTNTVSVVVDSIPEKIFRPERALNAAVFDAVMVGVAKRLQFGPITEEGILKQRYESLLEEESFQNLYKKATSDTENVKERLRLAVETFKDIP